MSNIFVRPARVSEIRTVTKLRMDAFGENGMVQSLFPDATRRAVDFPAWRYMCAEDAFADPGRHTIVAVEHQEDGTEEVVGSAEWIAPGGADPDTPKEELAAKNAERRNKWPSSINPAALALSGEAIDEAIKSGLKKVGLPEDANKDMWDLSSLAVDAKHQRKGIGRVLVQWGIDRAAEERKNILIVANSTGAHLYQKMGFEKIESFMSYAGEPFEQEDCVFLMRRQE